MNDCIRRRRTGAADPEETFAVLISGAAPLADTRVRGSLAPGHVPASASDSAKTEVAGHKQDDHDESDEPNDSVHVRLPRSETGLDGNRRFTTPRRRRNGSRGWARHRPCEDCNTRGHLLSMPDFDAMPSSSRCQLLAAMGGLALARTESPRNSWRPLGLSQAATVAV